MHENSPFPGILEHPTDLNLRLIYADWLEENGDLTRANFVRLQCELEPAGKLNALVQMCREHELVAAHRGWLTHQASLTKLKDEIHPISQLMHHYASIRRYKTQARVRIEENAQRVETLNQEREMLVNHQREWNVPLLRYLNETPFRNAMAERKLKKMCEWSYRRGFVEKLNVNAEAFLNYYYILMGLGPILHLRIRSMNCPLQTFLACPALRQIQTLDLTTLRLDSSDVQAFAMGFEFPELTNVQVDADRCSPPARQFLKRALSQRSRFPAMRFLASGDRTVARYNKT